MKIWSAVRCICVEVFRDMHLMLVFQIERRETDTGQSEITVALEALTPREANGSGDENCGRSCTAH